MCCLCLFFVGQISEDTNQDTKEAYQDFIYHHPFRNRASDKIVNRESIPKKDRPDLAYEQDFLSTIDPKLNRVPHGRRAEAYRYAQGLLKGKVALLAAISDVNWTERGPSNIGGRTRALMFDPNDAGDTKVWAGSVGGGLWFNNDITDGNGSWQNVDDFWANLAVTTLAYDPSTTTTFYAGTGEGFFNTDAVRGEGIWKSTDSGGTWSQLSATDNTDFNYVQKVIVTNSSTVLAATRTGIFRSTNGGTTWASVLAGMGYDLEIAANGDIYASTTGLIHKSTSASDGASGTWNDITPAVGGERIEMAMAPSDASYVYAIAAEPMGGVVWFKKSTDGGTTWSDITIPAYINPASCTNSAEDFSNGQAWYNLILAVSPSDRDFVLAGGIDLYRSEDGGAVWAPVSHWIEGGVCTMAYDYMHADQHAILFRPDHSDEAIFGNDGGVYYSEDIGTATRADIDSRNRDYNVTQYYSIAMQNTLLSNYLLAGAQDNGTLAYSSPGINSASLTTQITEATGGDGGFCHIDQDDATYQLTAATHNYIFLSTDAGTSFNTIATDKSKGRFINPSDYDDTPNILYTAGGEGELIRYSGITGTVSRTDLDLSATLGMELISHIRISPYTAHRLFIGTDGGNVYRIDGANGVPTVTDITGSLSVSGTVSSIDIGATDSDLLLTFSNYGIVNVWESSDGGTNWSNKEGNLPDMPIRWCLYHPSNRNEVLLATEVGVWSTDDISVASPDWQPSNSGLANVRCDMLQYRSADGLVAVATHGRGVYTSDVFAITTAVDFSSDRTIAYTTAPVQFIDGSVGNESDWSWDFGDTGTSTEQSPEHTYSAKGTYTVSLAVNSAADTETKNDYIDVLPHIVGSYLPADGGDFESNTDNFVIENISGTPFQRGSSPIIEKGGTTSGTKAWVTGLTAAQYANDSEARLYTPSFDFTESGVYSVSFSANYEFEDTFDGFIVQYSTDGGGTWSKLGDDVAAGWYTTAASISSNIWTPGEGIFSGTTDASYDPFTFDVSALAGNASVAFRFLYKTDEFGRSVGLAIDDFQLTSPTVLPISLIDFTATAQGSDLVLDWSTASEFNNQVFEVELMDISDGAIGERFSTIGSVEGSGTTSEQRDYRFVKNNMAPGTYLIQLRQVDYDGKYELFGPRKVLIVDSGTFDIQVYPNPFANRVTLSPSSKVIGGLTVAIVNINGRVVFKNHYPAPSSEITLVLDGLEEGIYFVQVLQGGQRATKKIIKRQ